MTDLENDRLPKCRGFVVLISIPLNRGASKRLYRVIIPRDRPLHELARRVTRPRTGET